MRQCITILTILILSGCSTSKVPQSLGIIGEATSYLGSIASDEARASLVGRDILSIGGNSSDAAVAMAFALMVSRPDAAGAGGGGVCLHYDSKKNQVVSLKFLPQITSAKIPKGYRAGTIPGSFRGLYALYAKFGKLRWEQLVKPAEQAARFGWPISKGLSAVLKNTGKWALKDAYTRNLFQNSRGEFLSAGKTIQQYELAGTLSVIRRQGPGYFYSGNLGATFIKGLKESGGWLTKENLRNYFPVWGQTSIEKSGNNKLHFPFFEGLGSEITRSAWKEITSRRGASSLSEARKAVIFTSSSKINYNLNIGVKARVGGSVGLSVMDNSGNATGCVLTMNNSFGMGYVAGSTGIIESSPTVRGSSLNIAPVIMVNEHLSQSYLVGTASGDQYAGSSLALTLTRLLNENLSLEKSLNMPRYAPGRNEVEIVVENSLPKKVIEAMIAKGMRPYKIGSLGRVNILYCKMGAVTGPGTCEVQTDPRTAAYGINLGL